MKKLKLSAAMISLIVVVGSLILSMFGYAIVKTNGFSVKETNYTLTLTELAQKMRENIEANGKDVDILFTENEKYTFSFATYVPKNATKENPAPVVVGCHGYNNSKEQQLSNITELTKRGFVVVVPDLAGHGRSDVDISELTKNTEGVLAAVNYAMTMDEVDNSKIGITGHSAGDLDAINTIKAVNVEGAKHRISSFFCPCGTISALFAMGQPNLILGVAAGKYDELDTHFFNSSEFLTSGIAKMLVKSYYPGFTGDAVEEGQWYSANGPVADPKNGETLGVTSAVAIWNPAVTHVGGMWTKVAAELTCEFFYDVYGVPTGSRYIAGGKQTWQLAAAFQILGILAFFASAIVFVANLLKTKTVKNCGVYDVEVRNGVVVDKLLPVQDVAEELPSIKDWKEIVPFLVTFIPLILFPFLTYYPCYNASERLLDGTTYNLPNVNGIALFTLVNGLFGLFMLFVNWGVKKLCHIKDGKKVVSPFVYAKLPSFKQFAKIAAFSLIAVALMYVPNFLAYNLAHMNFGLSVYTVGWPRFEWLPDMLFKYLPFWFVFMFVNSLFNAGCRYKEIPEWGSTLFIALANVFPIVLLIIINYTHLISEGQTYYTFGDPSIMIWNLLAPMVFIAITGRYYYKKTGNIWTTVFINALILTLMATTITRHTSSYFLSF